MALPKYQPPAKIPTTQKRPSNVDVAAPFREASTQFNKAAQFANYAASQIVTSERRVWLATRREQADEAMNETFSDFTAENSLTDPNSLNNLSEALADVQANHEEGLDGGELSNLARAEIGRVKSHYLKQAASLSAKQKLNANLDALNKMLAKASNYAAMGDSDFARQMLAQATEDFGGLPGANVLLEGGKKQVAIESLYRVGTTDPGRWEEAVREAQRAGLTPEEIRATGIKVNTRLSRAEQAAKQASKQVANQVAAEALGFFVAGNYTDLNRIAQEGLNSPELLPSDKIKLRGILSIYLPELGNSNAHPVVQKGIEKQREVFNDRGSWPLTPVMKKDLTETTKQLLNLRQTAAALQLAVLQRHVTPEVKELATNMVRSNSPEALEELWKFKKELMAKHPALWVGVLKGPAKAVLDNYESARNLGMPPNEAATKALALLNISEEETERLTAKLKNAMADEKSWFNKALAALADPIFLFNRRESPPGLESFFANRLRANFLLHKGDEQAAIKAAHEEMSVFSPTNITGINALVAGWGLATGGGEYEREYREDFEDVRPELEELADKQGIGKKGREFILVANEETMAAIFSGDPDKIAQAGWDIYWRNEGSTRWTPMFDGDGYALRFIPKMASTYRLQELDAVSKELFRSLHLEASGFGRGYANLQNRYNLTDDETAELTLLLKDPKLFLKDPTLPANVDNWTDKEFKARTEEWKAYTNLLRQWTERLKRINEEAMKGYSVKEGF